MREVVMYLISEFDTESKKKQHNKGKRLNLIQFKTYY